jgi:hypothetical protein
MPALGPIYSLLSSVWKSARLLILRPRVQSPQEVFFFAFLAQLAEHCANNAVVVGSIPTESFMSDWSDWRNGSAPAYGAGGCGFKSHVGFFKMYVLLPKSRKIETYHRYLFKRCNSGEECWAHIVYILHGEVAKWSNATGLGPVPSGSRVQTSPSSHTFAYGIEFHIFIGALAQR